MAILLYSNGIIEEYKPKGFVFTEEEIVSLFTEYEKIGTERLVEILNTWCIYGKSAVQDPIDFNKLASEITNKEIYSHMLFVHDSEINSDWKTSDSILYKSYDEFIVDIKQYINDIALNIVEEIESSIEDFDDKSKYLRLPLLETIGSTADKRILFGFNPSEQSSDFYQNEEFYIFSQKVYDYITNNKQENDPLFTIYADKKAVIIVDPMHVLPFLNTMLEKFKTKEEYEVCTELTNIIKNWKNQNKKPRRKKSPKNGQS